MMTKKLAAEFFGTFWLVFGGCGSAVLAAGVPDLGIGFAGVSLAFGLTVLTMAYAVGGISGGHFNPAVSLGLAVGGRFSWGELVPYWAAQLFGSFCAAGMLYVIASGTAGFAAGGFASNGYGELSPGGYSMLAALVIEVVLTAGVPGGDPRRDLGCGAGRLCADRHRAGADAHPPYLDPGDQHLGQSGALDQRRLLCRYGGCRPAVAVLGGAARRSGDRRARLEAAAGAQRKPREHRRAGYGDRIGRATGGGFAFAARHAYSPPRQGA